MSTNNTEQGHDQLPPGIDFSAVRPNQSWTLDGYPIVDGKYHDLATGEIKTHTGLKRAGPPSLSIYWNNCGDVTSPDHFFALGCSSRHTVTEYLARVGEMLRQGGCTISSLNATTYAVNVIVITELPSAEFKGRLREHGLIPS
jgi:hypothetical protein